MNFKLFSGEDKIKYRNDILKMLVVSDKEFVPPLSARTSTSQTNFKGGACQENGCASYCDDMLEGQILGAFSDGELLGFVAFRENVERTYITKESFPNVYVSTLIVKPSARGRGLTSEMYSYLFFELFPESNIFTRTWSTNIAHLKILSRFGFETFKTVDNDRGQGIDTVYFKLSAKATSGAC